MTPEWDDFLDEIDEFLEGQEDSAEGDPLEYAPNKAMRLLVELRRLREEGRP